MDTHADLEQCRRCGHRRIYHDPNCKFESVAEGACTCISFAKMNIAAGLDSVRGKVDRMMRELALELRKACSSDEEIEEEMHLAVERWAKGGGA
jgi:hypothetical protein